MIATGDMVELQNDRILFRGRRDHRIQVGGFKVDPVEIETEAMKVEGVVLAQAYGRRNPILGQLVALRFVAADTHQPDVLARRVRDRFVSWPPHKRPRLVEPVARIETNDSGKITR